jgi:3-oxoacyl-[acyl-carrier-protein] synthase III
MAFFEVENINIAGIAACVPDNLVETSKLNLFSEKEAQVFTQNTGIKQRYITDGIICASDLCFQAAENIIEKLNWKKNEIDILIFVSQTPDYILPATSNLLQNRLGLSKDCYCLDISLGCSGYVYGLSLIANLLQNKAFDKAILLVGDTISEYTSKYDKSVNPLFGDAGTATALEFNTNFKNTWSFDIGTDGSGLEAIKIKDGGSRNKITSESLVYHEIKNENEVIGKKTDLDLYLNGIDVFNFAIKTAPNSIKNVLEKSNTEIEAVDLFFLHQANLFISETVRKKLKVDKEKIPTSIQKFGNTNGASIAVTLVNHFLENKLTNNLKTTLCGFGVGLSWASVVFNLLNTTKFNMSFYDTKK